MVNDSPDVRQVVLGPNGIVEGAKPGSTVIDMSTISPAVTREIAGALAENRRRVSVNALKHAGVVDDPVARYALFEKRIGE